MVGATSLTPDPEAKLPIPAPALSGNLDARTSSPGAYTAFTMTAAHRTSIIDNCFTSSLDANVPASPGQVALVVAALKKDWKTVLRTLDAGASVETTDDAGVTPLMAAAMQGNVEVLRTLLERHASVDFTDLAGRCALHYALTAGKFEAVQLLLPLVSNIEALPTAENDLLTAALETGDMRIFQNVLERFPATLQWTANTRRALETALRADMKEQVRLLLSKHPAPPTREGGTVPLIA